MPSSRQHSWATAIAFWRVSAKSGWPARARSTSKRTAGYWPICSIASVRPGSGVASEGTRQAVSPAILSASRLVASTWRLGHARSRVSISSAHAATTCSQLSSTSSSVRVRRWSTRLPSSGRPGCSRRPSAAATSCGTNAGSTSGASSTSHTPCGYSSSSWPATLIASRVLPAPPEPVSVTNRAPRNSRLTSSSSCSRPTKLVSVTGRLWACSATSSVGWPNVCTGLELGSAGRSIGWSSSASATWREPRRASASRSRSRSGVRVTPRRGPWLNVRNKPQPAQAAISASCVSALGSALPLSQRRTVATL